MLKAIQSFAAKPLSGYLFIALALAAAGAGYWFWTELKEFGGLEQKAEDQRRDIRSLENQVSYLQGRADLKAEVNTQLLQTKADIKRFYDGVELDIREALQDAPKEYIDCRAMPVPERLQHPKGRQATNSDE